MSNDLELQIIENIQLYVGSSWGLVVPLISESGSVSVSSVSAQLLESGKTSDVLSTYSTGSASFSGNNIITPLIGVGSGPVNIPPGNYTLFLTVTYNGGIQILLFQQFEFRELVGR